METEIELETILTDEPSEETKEPILQDINIFLMSWNTESLRFCGTDGTENTFKPQNLLFGNIPCEPIDFLNILVKEVIQKSHRKYDVVIFSLQEDAFPGSYLIPEAANKLMAPEYKLIAFSEWLGVGVTSWKALKEKRELLMRGLRLAIYVKDIPLFHNIKTKTIIERCAVKDYLTSGKGSIIVQLIHPETFGNLVVIDMHLPFSASSLFDPEKREESLSKQNECFSKIWKRAINTFSPTYLIMLGDMNYRISKSKLSTTTIYDYISKQQWRRLYQEGDELKMQIENEKIPLMKEGPLNEGPLFAPTCKMKKGRPSEKCSTNEELSKNISICYSTGKEEQRMPSWCDRILYNTYQSSESFFPIVCLFYERWEWGKVMTESDHSSVIAHFIIPAKNV